MLLSSQNSYKFNQSVKFKPIIISLQMQLIFKNKIRSIRLDFENILKNYIIQSLIYIHFLPLVL